jgi:D-amino-acid dehydrogenase
LLRDLSLASRRCFEDLASLPGNDFGLVKKGLLMLCKTEHTLAEEARAAQQANQLGIPAEVLTPAQTEKIEPGIRFDIAGSVYFPLDCHLTPQRLVASLTRSLEQGGASFSWSTEVTGWVIKAGRIAAAQTNQGEIAADEYVIAGGSWSPNLLRGLDLRLPLQAGKGYSITLPHPKRLPAICSILAEARVAVTPMDGALRFGGTMEIAGLNQSISGPRVNGIIKSIEDFRDVPVWCGLRPCSPDGLPYLGRFSRYPNLSAATGHAMMGLSLGPITGKLMAEILSDEKPAIDLRPLSPDRYE